MKLKNRSFAVASAPKKIIIYKLKRKIATQKSMDASKVKIKQYKRMIKNFKSKRFNVSKIEKKLKILEIKKNEKEKQV